MRKGVLPGTLLSSLRWIRRPRVDQRGQTTVEFVLIVPLLLVLVYLIFEVGRALGSWLLITNAVREGARYAAVQALPCGTACQGNIANVVQQRAEFLQLDTAACQNNQVPTGHASCISVIYNLDPQTGDDMMTVLVHYQLQTLMPITGSVPFLGSINYPGYIDLPGESTMRAEQ